MYRYKVPVVVALHVPAHVPHDSHKVGSNNVARLRFHVYKDTHCILYIDKSVHFYWALGVLGSQGTSELLWHPLYQLANSHFCDRAQLVPKSLADQVFSLTRAVAEHG